MARIMIVDPNPDSAHTLGMALSILGHEPMPAYGGIHAIELTPETQPDMMLLDMVNPDLDGYETLRRLRTHAGSDEFPVLVVMPTSAAEAEAQVLAAGGTACLAKPISLETLSGEIARHLGPVRREIR